MVVVALLLLTGQGLVLGDPSPSSQPTTQTSASRIVIRNNTLTDSGFGIYVGPRDDKMVVVGNRIKNNAEGIRIVGTTNLNKIRNNRIVENLIGVKVQDTYYSNTKGPIPFPDMKIQSIVLRGNYIAGNQQYGVLKLLGHNQASLQVNQNTWGNFVPSSKWYLQQNARSILSHYYPQLAPLQFKSLSLSGTYYTDLESLSTLSLSPFLGQSIDEISNLNNFVLPAVLGINSSESYISNESEVSNPSSSSSSTNNRPVSKEVVTDQPPKIPQTGSEEAVRASETVTAQSDSSQQKKYKLNFSAFVVGTNPRLVQFTVDHSWTFPEGYKVVWKFGDGMSKTGSGVIHLYSDYKTYHVQVALKLDHHTVQSEAKNIRITKKGIEGVHN